MAKKTNGTAVITGNRLTDGVVVYLTAEGAWTERVEDATATAEPELRQSLEEKANAAIAKQEVTHWEAIEVELRDGLLTAVKNMEAIRSRGPTVRRDLGKQAEIYA